MEALWNLLAKKSIWEVAGFAVVFVSAAWAFVLAIVYLIKKARFKKVSTEGVEFLGKDGTEKTNPHAACVHGRDIVMVLKKQAEMINAVHDLHDGVMPEQMKYAESRGADLRGLVQKAFLHLLDEEISAGRLEDRNIVDHEDYRSYKLCVKAIYDDLRDFIRVAYRENHYAMKDEQEFRAYVDNKVDEIMQRATDALNDMYRGRLVDRSRVYKENQRITPEIREVLSDLFWNARAVSLKAEAECKALENDFEEYLSATIG